MKIPLKHLMAACFVLAAIFVISSYLEVRAPNPDFYAWIPGIPQRVVSGVCALTCIVLVIYGLVVHRLRGIWLLLPLLVVLFAFWVYAHEFSVRVCGPNFDSCP